MKFVALLRGINVGGNNKVNMKLLKKSFERVYMESVKTYINSGNIIFETKESSKKKISKILEQVILEDFDLPIKVLIRSFNEIKNTVNNIPQGWVNDSIWESVTIYLWDEIDNEIFWT